MSKASSRTFERGFVFHLSWNVTPRVCGDADLAQELSDFVQAVIKGVWKSPFVVGESRGRKVASVVSGEADLARDLSGLCFVMLFWFVTMSPNWTMSSSSPYAHFSFPVLTFAHIHTRIRIRTHIDVMQMRLWHTYECQSCTYMIDSFIKCAMISFTSHTEVLVVESISIIHITHTHSSSSPQVVHFASFASSIWKKTNTVCHTQEWVQINTLDKNNSLFLMLSLSCSVSLSLSLSLSLLLSLSSALSCPCNLQQCVRMSCVWLCSGESLSVWERQNCKREREKDSERMCMCACVCVCVRVCMYVCVKEYVCICA